MKKELQDKIMREALEFGFTDCEIFYRGSENFEVLLLEGKVSNYENSKEDGLSFRGTFDGKMGYAYTELLDEKSIPFLLQEAKENAQILPSEDAEELFAGEDAYPTFDGINPKLSEMSIEQRIELAHRMEKAALGGADSISSLDYCVIGMGKSEIAIANTKGLSLHYGKNSAMGYVSAIAKRGEETKTGSAFWKGQNWADFNPEKVGLEAAEDASMYLGAKTIASGEYKVAMAGKAMASLLGVFSGVFYGENVQKGFSLLKDKVGETIGAECVTLRDDPLLLGGYASVPFDSEGVSSKNKAVIANGVLQTLLYNRKTAKIDGVVSTGNGFKGGLASPVKTSCTNFYIQKGETSFEGLLEQVEDGLYITGLMGLHAGTNAVSGDFSLSAEGFLIKDGKLDTPVEQITVAGNFYQLLKDVLVVGDDLYFQSGGKGSPTLFISKLHIAGE